MKSKRYYDEDSVLAEKAQQGDKRAFGELVEKYQKPIYSSCFHFFRDATKAEDAAQDTFLRAFRFLHTYDVSRKFPTWLYAIARNLCIDRHREYVRRGEVSRECFDVEAFRNENGRNPMQELAQKEDEKLLVDAIHNLPEKYKTPLTLCYLEGLAYQEISEIMGISLNNTKIRIFRAKKRILDELGLDGDGNEK